MNQIIMAITGASGAPYARRLLECLVRADVRVHLCASPAAARVAADELGIKRLTAETLLGSDHPNVTQYSHRDIGARIASGSFLVDGMVVCPCSSHTLAAIAAGLGDNLISRAAMVTLKEARRLVLVPREMPLSTIELENMLRLARSGVIICQASPGFYLRPQSVDDLVDFVVARALDLLGVPHDLPTRWQPPDTAEPDP